MKLLYLINLFIVCSSSFIMRPSYLPIKFNPSNISIDIKNKINYNNDKIELLLKKSFININLKKNNKDIINDINKKYEFKSLINFIYNIILYSYIFSHS